MAVSFSGAGHNFHYLSPLGNWTQFWLADSGLTIIVLAWIFSIVMFLLAGLREDSIKPSNRNADAYAHLVVGIALVLAALLFIAYVIACAVWFCKEETDCGKYFILELRGWNFVAGAVSMEIMLEKFEDFNMNYVGLFQLFALIHAGICLRIFQITLNTGKVSTQNPPELVKRATQF